MSSFTTGFGSNVTTEGANSTLLQLFPDDGFRKLFFTKPILSVTGLLILCSNLIVVISSWIISRKAQHQKAAYLFLGNVSLADTCIGVIMTYGSFTGLHQVSPTFCIIHSAIMITPVIVSIYSVGMIAIDRYIYIVHGLYYNQWVNTTRVRLAILFTWTVGLTVGFLPAIKSDIDNHESCWYVVISPPEVIISSAIISILPIILVTATYPLILCVALKKVNEIKHVANKTQNKSNKPVIYVIDEKTFKQTASNMSREDDKKFEDDLKCKELYDSRESISSNITVCTIIDKAHPVHDELNTNETDSSFKSHTQIINQIKKPVTETNTAHTCNKNIKSGQSTREPNKWRAIKIVTFSIGSLLFTWTPFLIVQTIYAGCLIRSSEEECTSFRKTYFGPLSILGKFNCLLNPLIYAWWHPAFRKSFIKIVKQFKHRFFKK